MTILPLAVRKNEEIMMKRTITISAVLLMLTSLASTVQADFYEFWFSEEDLWNHTVSSDTRLYNQDAPRRHHTVWKGDVQTTDSTQPNQNAYQTTTGTSGWYQTATYDSWLNVAGGGPKDSSGNDFGFTEVQLWGAGWPNSSLAWNERYRVNAGADAWQILATPTGWTGSIVDNPWDDNGSATPLDQYFILWNADSYTNDRILYSSYGNGVDDYLFGFRVDIIGEYPTTLESSPDGNPFEDDDFLRLWFGGYVADYSGTETTYLYQDGNWYTWADLPGLPEGYDGIMKVVPVPGAVLLGILGLGAVGIKLRKFA
jgi:hypothetical protein